MGKAKSTTVAEQGPTVMNLVDGRLLALGKALELRRILQAIVTAEGKDRPLTCCHDALDRMMDVVGMLVPEPPEFTADSNGEPGVES